MKLVQLSSKCTQLSSLSSRTGDCIETNYNCRGSAYFFPNLLSRIWKRGSELRHKFNRTRKGIVPDPDNMLIGFTATKAAYQHGEPWRQAMLDYLRGNHDYLLQAINDIPGLSMKPMQATYLAWINVSALNLDDPHQFFADAGVGLSPGKQFGDDRYLRLNFGCSRQLLEEAIARIRKAAESIQK